VGDMRVGIVGTGFAATAHIEAVRRIPGARVVALAGSSQKKADAAADALGVDRSFGTVEALLDHVDAVHNCTPNHLHAAINHAVLDAGKHLLCEKPLALDSRETGALVAAASAARAVTGVCFNYRHFPLVQEARSRLASGDLGPPHFAHGAYLQDWLLYPDDWNWRLESSRAGASRAIADIGSHWLDLVQHITGDRVTAVFADLTTLHAKRSRPAAEVATFERSGAAERETVAVDTEDFGSVALRFASGCKGAVNVSQVSAGRKNRLTWEIDTPTAALAWNQEEPNTLWIGRRDAVNSELVRDPTLLGAQSAPLAHLPGGHQEGWADALKNLVLDFYAAVRARETGDEHVTSVASFADAHRVTLIVEAILASHRAGAWVDVAEGDRR
jgi:predicted dehydrogenase